MFKSFQRHHVNAKNHASRVLHIESLENRELLSAVSPTADTDDFADNVSALISTEDGVNGASFVEMNLATVQSAAAPLDDDSDFPQVQAAPTLNDADVVAGDYVKSNPTYLEVKVRSTSSTKVEVSWNDIGAESYTVKYTLLDDHLNPVGATTTKVVKGKTNLSISVKTDRIYDVTVTPQGMADKEDVTVAAALSKLKVKAVDKTDSSISFQITRTPMWEFGCNGVLGIKAPNEKTYTYYDVFPDTENGQSGALSYSFEGDILTVKGLAVNTKYSFQFAQAEKASSRSLISPYTTVSAATNKLKTTKIVVNALDDEVNTDKTTSLREAIQKATDGAVITFAKNIKGQSIRLVSPLVINKNITIDASSLYDANNDEPGVSFILASSDYGLKVNGAKNVTIKGIKFASAGGVTGSAIYCYGQTDSVFNIQNCHFLSLGKACWFEGTSPSAIANINHCAFDWVSSYNVTNASKGKMNVTNCDFEDCSGVAIYNKNNSSLFVSQTEFEDNYKICYNESGTSEFNRCQFHGNTGYIIYNKGVARLYNSLVVDNDVEESNWACFWNYNQGEMYIQNITSALNRKTFRNDGDDWDLRVYASVCSTSNYGTGDILRSNCLTLDQSKLDKSYRPVAFSPCIDAGAWTSSYWTEKDLAGNARLMGSRMDIGCYEYFPVSSRSTTSGKTTIYWEDSGASSYTVQYRPEDTQKWTTKTVKNKTELTISVKNDTLYDVLVTPVGSSNDENQIIWAGGLTKLGMKVVSKTSNSVTFKVSNAVEAEMSFKMGIKTKTDKNFVYYDFWETDDYMGPYYYEFDGDTLTIWGLSSNTKYDFQFAQYIDFAETIMYLPSYAISTFAKVSVTTTK
ncbi:MAG: right-handed parallel beta-helix repeat-containing protein [Thermoguttaceae bacterium]|nr:right-handed parallel beta-helix repeat-containing protein [Thermoguttaceae bacterium]